ncbi:MAG: metallophosphoesterase [Nitrosarchaeum sp.]
MKEELLKFCQEKSILLDTFLLDFFVELNNYNQTRVFIEKIKNITQKRFLTKSIIDENKGIFEILVKNVCLNDNKKYNYFIEKITPEKKIEEVELEQLKEKGNVVVNSKFVKPGKQIKVEDFVEYFRNRYEEMSKILQENYDFSNLTSITKLESGNRGSLVIGIVNQKELTKNGNIILEIEDFSGNIKVLIRSDNKELIKEAEDISLDSILGFKGTSNGEVMFVDKIIFPDTKLKEKKYSNNEEYALFIGDLHYGSKKFMKKSFDNFISYLCGEHENTPEIDKIKYLFISGDLVTGVGNYPNQEKDLVIGDLESQFQNFANELKKIRKDITIIITPGNHDCVRIMEPQPKLNSKYAWPLYELKNVIFTENPAYVKIAANEKFKGFNVLCYHGFSFPYYANNIPKLVKADAMNDPTKIMKYLLKNRHLAPAHTSTQYFPDKIDPLLIREIPDIFVSGHTHKSDITIKDNILIVSVSTWEGITDYQIKLGNKPDHAKVPMINLKTRAIKILDFEVPEENIEVYKE